MLVVKKTGLVPVLSAVRGGPAGIFGVFPATAREGLRKNTLVLADIPSDIPTYEVAGPEPVVVETPPQEDAGEDLIPADWTFSEEVGTFIDAGGKIHALKRIKIAQKISGQDIVLTDEDKANEVGKAEKADAIILAEIQRRAAADTSAE